MVLPNRFKQLNSRGHFQFALSFDFPKSIPASLGNDIKFLKGSTCHPFPFWTQWRVSCSGKLASSYACLFCSAKRWTVLFFGQVVPDKRPFFLSSFVLQGRITWESVYLSTVNKLKSALLKSRVCCLPFSWEGVRYIENYQRRFLSGFCLVLFINLNCSNSFWFLILQKKGKKKKFLEIMPLIFCGLYCTYCPSFWY